MHEIVAPCGVSLERRGPEHFIDDAMSSTSVCGAARYTPKECYDILSSETEPVDEDLRYEWENCKRPAFVVTAKNGTKIGHAYASRALLDDELLEYEYEWVFEHDGLFYILDQGSESEAAVRDMLGDEYVDAVEALFCWGWNKGYYSDVTRDQSQLGGFIEACLAALTDEVAVVERARAGLATLANNSQ